MSSYLVSVLLLFQLRPLMETALLSTAVSTNDCSTDPVLAGGMEHPPPPLRTKSVASENRTRGWLVSEDS